MAPPFFVISRLVIYEISMLEKRVGGVEEGCRRRKKRTVDGNAAKEPGASGRRIDFQGRWRPAVASTLCYPLQATISLHARGTYTVETDGNTPGRAVRRYPSPSSSSLTVDEVEAPLLFSLFLSSLVLSSQLPSRSVFALSLPAPTETASGPPSLATHSSQSLTRCFRKIKGDKGANETEERLGR